MHHGLTFACRGAPGQCLRYGRMPRQRRVHQASTRVMSILMVLLGLALLVRTLAAGGGPAATGVLLGALFIVAGAARLYLHLRG